MIGNSGTRRDRYDPLRTSAVEEADAAAVKGISFPGWVSITSTSFFGATQRSITTKSGKLSVWANVGLDSIESLASQQPFWFEADALAKLFHSTIITDLGQQSYEWSNIRADASLLQYFTLMDIYDRSFRDGRGWMFDTAGRMRHDYNSLKETTGPLGVQPSVIAARYLCHVPRL